METEITIIFVDEETLTEEEIGEEEEDDEYEGI